MDTELFMECEEEELEPWQQVDDSVEEDDMDFDNYCEPVEDSRSPPPASETPPARCAPCITSAPAAWASIQNISSMAPPPPSHIMSSSCLPVPSSTSSSCLPRLPLPSSVSSSCLPVPSSVSSSCLPLPSSVSSSCLPVPSSVSSSCLPRLPVPSSVSSSCLPVPSSVSSSCLPLPSSVSSSCLPVPSSVSSSCLPRLPVPSSVSSSCLPVPSSVSSSCLPLPSSVSSSCLPRLPVPSSVSLSCLPRLPVPSSVSSSCLPRLPASSSVSSSCLPRLPASSSPAVSAPTLMAQAPPLILTRTAGGTFLVPAASATSSAPPILLTAQGFPVPTVMNPPLLLNLQPGQTVQPLTVIQSSSLSHLMRSSVAVPLRPQTRAPTPQPLSGLTAVQLPTPLTIRASTPASVNLQLNQVSRANSLKLPAAVASVNGVTTTASFSTVEPNGSSGPAAPTPAPVKVPSVTPAQPPEPPRVVMSVEEFYYGVCEGDLSLRNPQPVWIKSSSFTCHICSYPAENNLRLMQHMLQHSELIRGGGHGRKCCRFCYRQFSSPAQLNSHQEQVHGAAPSTSMCRICEWAFEKELIFLNHMKSNHKPGEMPYICQVCSYRSSFYLDVLQHFASFHMDSRFLLCVFCLKVTTNPHSYQQHVLRHQINEAFHCNRCRLQFIFLKDKMQHKLENHRSVRRPAQLEGLPLGSKVAIRNNGNLRRPMASAGLLLSPSSLVQPIHIKTENPKASAQRSPVPTKRPVSHRVRVSRTSPRDGGRLVCLECGTDASDFSAHYPTHVRCLLCPYSSCCSRAYAAHMIHLHVPRSKGEALPLHQMPPPCLYLLRCSRCGLSPQTADQMAEHLLTSPGHHSASCHPRTYTEEDDDLQLCHSEEPPSAEKGPGPNWDLPEPSWRSADRWKQPLGRGSKPTVVPFSETSGPQHCLSKNSDAIDFFNLIFPSTLVELITKETNAHIKTCQFLGSCLPDWVPVTTHEVKGFIGLLILMGIQNLPDPSHYWSWSHYDNSYTFYRAMSFKRFKQIAANIRMGSFTTDEYRGSAEPSDPLHIFRPMLEILGGAMWDAYGPNCCLTIDSALLPGLEANSRSKGNPRTQPQVWLLCDSKSGYCHRFFIQLGEKAGEDPGFAVVPELLRGLEGKHHQVYLANSLTSVPLVQKLLDQGIYASSSFPPSNPILPKALWEQGQLEKPGDFLQRTFGPLLLTRWRDTKEMACLSTNAAPGEPDTVWRRSRSNAGGLEPIERPMAFRLLQENMRGVDICKQLLACNPLGGIHPDRHWRSLFWFLVNLSIVNAFIVLRESRRESPPAWVRDGLFTQVTFRKRLGNQLAKCAQKCFDSVEIAVARGVRTDSMKRSHTMTKISSFPKRCRTCASKNVRRVTTYGCGVCKASLCQRPSCFLEYHSASAADTGSTTAGFKDGNSGAVEADEAMAPVEDMDFSEDERLDNLDEEELISEDPGSATDDLGPPRTACTARQLRIALSALCDGLHQASRAFSTEVELICMWLKEAQKRLTPPEADQQPGSDGEARLVAWVLSMREQQLPVTDTSLFHKASALKKKGRFADSFRFSYAWALDFMLRHRLGVQSGGRAAALARSLPPLVADKVTSFRSFTQRTIRGHALADSGVAAMDELCLFVDLALARDLTRCSEALMLTGSSPLLTVYLAVLADGTMLPSLLQVNGHVADRVLPESVLLEAAAESLPVEDALAVWTNAVWRQHVSKLAQVKSVLVLDRHREHVADLFLTSVSGAGTLPAVIPPGCSFCLQPLEVCLKPALQRFVLLRWEKFTSGESQRSEETPPRQLQADVAELLVDWLVEGLAQLNKLPQLWRRSFELTELLPGRQEGRAEAGRNPDHIQLDLLNRVTEALMGSEVLEADPLNLDLEQEPEGGERREEVEKPESEVAQKQTETREQDDKEAAEQKREEEESEEEGKEMEEEVNKERRETRIVTGEDVGDEWKVKSRTEGAEDEGP